MHPICYDEVGLITVQEVTRGCTFMSPGFCVDNVTYDTSLMTNFSLYHPPLIYVYSTLRLTLCAMCLAFAALPLQNRVSARMTRIMLW